MASKKFQKGTEVWMMFMDFWKICQDFWEPEKDDSYWNALIDSVEFFVEKYKTVHLAKELAIAFVKTQDKKYRELKK